MAKVDHVHQKDVFSMFDTNAVLVHFELKHITGSVNGAIWLSQILYWYDKGWKKDEIYKSRRELTKETGLSRDQQLIVENKLKRLNIVTITVKPGRPSPVNHIKINFEQLYLLIEQYKLTLDSKTRNLTYEKSVKQISPNTENITKNTPMVHYKENTIEHVEPSLVYRERVWR